MSADPISDVLITVLDEVRSGLVPIFDVFRDERVAIGSALAILVVALGFGVSFWLVHWPPW